MAAVPIALINYNWTYCEVEFSTKKVVCKTLMFGTR